jgi:CHAD domain-containing protein
VAKARAIDGLDPARPYAEAARRIVSVRADELAEQSHDVLEIGDIERVHDMRVATRRLRAALEAFEPCFPARLWRTTLKDVKRLADALGERRDRDVAIATLERFAGAVPDQDAIGIRTLIAELRREQADANDELARHVTTERLESLGARLRELVESAR